jgi:hypothetical protein
VEPLPLGDTAASQTMTYPRKLIVAPEVGKELCIFVDPQKLAYDLDGEHLGVAERWSGSATSETSEILDAVV